jgi:hypothetical protein
MKKFVQKSALFVTTVGDGSYIGVIVAALLSFERKGVSKGVVWLAGSMSDDRIVETEELFASRLSRLTGALSANMIIVTSTVWLIAICIDVLVEPFGGDVVESKTGRLDEGIIELS